jgi:ankyrin repeat protein
MSNKMTGLHVAGQHGFQTIAFHEIQNYRPYTFVLNCKNSLDYTPLHYAVTGGHLEIASELLDAQADIDCWDLSKATTLIVATSSGNHSMADLILTYSKAALDLNA